MADDEVEKDSKFIQSWANDLRKEGEFDSVFILATKRMPAEGQTSAVASNVGNFYASIGAINEYLVKNDERSRISARNE